MIKVLFGVVFSLVPIPSNTPLLLPAYFAVTVTLAEGEVTVVAGLTPFKSFTTTVIVE
jgi:hypothetical protein